MTDTEKFIKDLNEEFVEYIDDHCNDIGACSHDNTQEVIGCFFGWLEEQLPGELHYNEDSECWELQSEGDVNGK